MVVPRNQQEYLFGAQDHRSQKMKENESKTPEMSLHILYTVRRSGVGWFQGDELWNSRILLINLF